MDCKNCEHLGSSGNRRVCGWLLNGGETVYVKNNKINDVCPKLVNERYLELIKRGRILLEKGGE